MVIIPRSPQENGNSVKDVRKNGNLNISQQSAVGMTSQKHSSRTQQQFEVNYRNI